MRLISKHISRKGVNYKKRKKKYLYYNLYKKGNKKDLFVRNEVCENEMTLDES